MSGWMEPDFFGFDCDDNPGQGRDPIRLLVCKPCTKNDSRGADWSVVCCCAGCGWRYRLFLEWPQPRAEPPDMQKHSGNANQNHEQNHTNTTSNCTRAAAQKVLKLLFRSDRHCSFQFPSFFGGRSRLFDEPNHFNFVLCFV